MEKNLILNPSLRINPNYIDYPYFLSINTILISGLLKNYGLNVDVIDMFAQHDSSVVKEKEQIFIGSKTKLNDLINVDYNNIIIINSPYLKLFSRTRNVEFQQILSFLKTKSKKIILADCFFGGMHYVQYDKEMIHNNYPEVDHVFTHECEKDLLCFFDKRMTSTDLDDLPLPDYDAINIDNYLTFLRTASNFSQFMDLNNNPMPVFTSRGCVYNCKFCTSKLNDRFYREYSMEYVENHLKILERYNIQTIIILDELPNISSERLDMLVRLLNKYGFKYEFPNGIRADQISDKTVSLIGNNVSCLKISAECGNEHFRNSSIGKNLKSEDIISFAQNCSLREIPLYIHYMVGLPRENLKGINETLEFAADLFERFNAIPLIQRYVEFPGTKFCSESKNCAALDDNYFDMFSLKTAPSGPISYALLFENFKRRIQSNLSKLIINTTYKCNNNCIFCAVGDMRYNQYDIDAQKRVLKEKIGLGIKTVDFDGGEPTISKNTVKLIIYARKLGYSNISLTTNGRMFSDYDLADIFVRLGLDSILFSLHGPKKIHDQITNTEGSYIQTINGMANIVKLIRKHNKLTDLRVNVTLTKWNIKSLESIYSIINNFKIKVINLQFLTPFGSAKKVDLPKDEDLRYVYEFIDKHSADVKINIANATFCQLKNYESFLHDDTLKSERNMVFIGSPESNLKFFLSKKRYKDKRCYYCHYNVICSGFWSWE